MICERADEKDEMYIKIGNKSMEEMAKGYANYNKQERNSSIECLKLVGLTLIVIGHVIQTLHSPNIFVGVQDYLLDISMATTKIQNLILAMLSTNGAFGNTLFFVCSAWFLLDSTTVSKKKMLQMILDIWIVSVIILILVLILRGGNVNVKMIIKSLLPNTFGNNWYMTCYLMFYTLHPYLNNIIVKLDQKALLRISLVLCVLYIGVNYIQDVFFYSSPLVLWITLYFMIGYMKNYLRDISNNTRVNFGIFWLGVLGNYGMILMTNVLGLRLGVFSNQLLRWSCNNSPFIIMMAVGLFNIARNIHFSSYVVNKLSSLSLYIYIIHENILLRSYYRPMMWQWVYENYGYKHVLYWVMIIALVVLLFALITSVIYELTMKKCVVRIVEKSYLLVHKWYLNIENKLLRYH